MYERFNSPARRALEEAREAARVRESELIDGDHVLMGLVVANGPAAVALAEAGVTVDRLQHELGPTVSEPSRPMGTAIPFSESGKAMLLETVRAATSAEGLAEIGDIHVLVGLLSVNDRGVEVLGHLGVDAGHLRAGLQA